MDIKQQTYFLELARTGNMTQAAEALYLSQSALSQFLSKLEGELGTPLFHREKNRLTLTAAGEVYADIARRGMALREELDGKLAALAQRGRIRLGVTSRWGMELVRRVLPLFREDWPGVALEITQASARPLRRMLEEGAVDLAALSTPLENHFSPPPEAESREELLLVVYGEGLRGETAPLTLEELELQYGGADFLLSKPQSSVRQVVDRALPFRPNVICELDQMDAILDLVALGVGVAFVPASCAAKRGEVRYHSLNPPLERANLLLVRRGLAMGPAERALLSLLKQSFP